MSDSSSKIEVKHTPGPHYAAAQNDALFIIAGRAPSPDNDYPMHDADRTVLAKVCFGEGSVSFDEARANSRLYAAAPGLLSIAKQHAATLEYYIRVDERSGDDEGARLKAMTLHMVRETIAKAEDR